MNKKHHVFLITTLVVVAVLLAGLATQNLKAQVSSLNLSGWSWSSYNTGPGASGSPGGLGWTSFNADNHAAGPSYKVSINSISGDLSGQAFSSNYGWLSFDRAVTGNPPFEDVGSGSGAIAKRDGSNNITGWARFISACKNDLWDAVNRKCTGSGAGNANGVSTTASTTTTTIPTGGDVMMAADYGGYIYISRNGGVTWSQATTPGTGTWLGTAMSSDGKYMIAVKYYSRIYTSDDSGVTWVARTGPGSQSWSDAAISSDGKYLVASDNGGYIWVSTDYGFNWTSKTSAGSRSWNDVVASDDGRTIAASTNNSIYISKDGGDSWTLSTSSVGIAWTDIEITADGSSYFVGMSSLSGGKSAVYTSSDGGLTWIKRIESSANSPKWDGLSMTPDGKQITAGLTDSQACTKTSYDYGYSWTTGHCESGSYIFDTTTSGDGNKIISTFKDNSKNLYISNDKGLTWAPIASAGLHDWNKIEMNRGLVTQQQTNSTQQNAYWDGWVSLNRKATDTVAYGLTYDTTAKAVKGYAWGSNNVGWIWFDPTGCAPGSDCNPVVGSDPITGSCSVSPTNLALTVASPSADATWAATGVSGGKGAPFHYTWAGTGIPSGSNTSSVTATYTAPGTYSASVLISDRYYTSTTTSPILCSNNLTVTGPGGGGGGGGSCTTPDNAQLCTGSNQSSGPIIVGEYGSCPTVPTTPAICQFQCIDDTYIVRGYSCVKKSTTVEQ